MSQKSYTVLTAAVTFAIPQGKTQAQALDILREAAKAQFLPGTVAIKLTKRETHYINPQ
jgi:hypothetical protein